jgi:transposase InsO family protein
MLVYAIGRAIDTWLTLAAFRSAIADRQPKPRCVDHLTGEHNAADQNRGLLAKHGLRGSMGRRGIPYDNAKAEGFMKTIKTEEVYLGGYETFTDVVHALPHFTDEGLQQTQAPIRARISEPYRVRGSTRRPNCQSGTLIPVHPLGCSPKFPVPSKLFPVPLSREFASDAL